MILGRVREDLYVVGGNGNPLVQGLDVGLGPIGPVTPLEVGLFVRLGGRAVAHLRCLRVRCLDCLLYLRLVFL